MTDIVEVRCPVGPRRLFTKLRLAGKAPRYIQPDNLIEFPCSDCTRRTGGKVFHRFNFLGDLIQTVTAPKEQ